MYIGIGSSRPQQQQLGIKLAKKIDGWTYVWDQRLVTMKLLPQAIFPYKQTPQSLSTGSGRMEINFQPHMDGNFTVISSWKVKIHIKITYLYHHLLAHYCLQTIPFVHFILCLRSFAKLKMMNTKNKINIHYFGFC